MSDGDCDEGSTWEALLFAAQHRLDNLTVIVDYNRVQALGFSQDVLDLEPFARKLEDCRWAVKEVDGHDVVAIDQALREAALRGRQAVVAHLSHGQGQRRQLRWRTRSSATTGRSPTSSWRRP